jgi:hypothetical protein
MKMFAISVPVFVLMAIYGDYGKQIGLNAEAESSLNLQIPSGVKWVETSYPTSAARSPFWRQLLAGWFESYSRRHPSPANWTFPATTPAQCSIQGLLDQCMQVSGTHYYMPFGVAGGHVIFGHPTSLPGAQWVLSFEGALQTNSPEWWDGVGLRRENLVLVRQSATKVYVVPPNMAAGMTNATDQRMAWNDGPEAGRIPPRVALPDKAPTDTTWTSPFGPLTSKAARAAAPILANEGERSEPLMPRSEITADTRMSLSSPSLGFPQAEGIVAEITGRQLLPRTNTLAENLDDMLRGQLSRLQLIQRMPPVDTGLRVHRDGAFTASEVLNKVTEFFATNGVSLVPVGQKYYRAVETAKLAEYRTSVTGGRELAWLAVHQRPFSLLYTYSLIIALVCGTAGLPHILVRFYTNPDGVAAKRTTMWVMIFIGVFYLFPPVFGALGRNFMPELYAAAGAKGTDKIVLELPRVLNQRFAPWGSVLSGITCAGAFAAFMSTFSGLLVSMTGALAHDVYGRMLRPAATQRDRLVAFKVCAVLVGAVAILLGMQVEQFQINFMVGQAFAIAAASYFPLLFMSTWWRGMTMMGAATGMLAGGLLALAGITLTSFSDLKWLPLAHFWAMHPLWRIVCEQPAIWTVPLAIGLMVIVSKCTKSEIPADVRMKMLVLHAPETLGLKQEYIQEHTIKPD